MVGFLSLIKRFNDPQEAFLTYLSLSMLANVDVVQSKQMWFEAVQNRSLTSALNNRYEFSTLGTRKKLIF